ncbi:MAG: peptidase S8 and S53 subtilisin kexin sedolisin [Candidatus Berkelbacteria bacterium Licking1014_96]|uniref:Peptidase S8 and S53 subtilisin kexin sedolisin n=1 Tax=Candidatus Berkelbacteria bacterium Licking1014_96 TaxID=2017149 RepID=A0A554LDI4_9BACT|nr:MAG: peptidase S8 and S53 subtilisin kexin sedolisin [Candidatus Berkelbacteria bacterium Licking1014_96]
MSKFHDLFIKDGRAKVTVAVLIVFLVLASLGIYFSFYINPKTASQSLPPHAKNRVIVKFKESAKENLKKEDVIAGPDVGISSVTTLNQKEDVKEVKKIVPSTSSDELGRTYTIEFKNDKDINSVIKKYSSDPNIEYAEPDYQVTTQVEPNDPYYASSGSWGQAYADLWGIKKINSSAAWDITTGSISVVVAVIDTGIDYNHPDLVANVWVNSDEVPNNGVDDDGNGYIDDYHGYDFYNEDGDPFDDHAHGTHVSGTIGGVGNNGVGVVGINWQTKIMGVKFLSSGGSGYISDAVSSTYYAVNNGAKVLSNSWGGGGRSTTMQTAIDYAYNHGVVFVAAAGNSNSDAYNYTPAGLNHVMTIAATDYQDNKASFSSWGDVVEFAAPGVDVLSLKSSGGSCTTVGTNYCRMSGTSMATPHAAGLAALVLSINPSMTPDQVQTAMQNGADDLGAPGKDIYFGYGRINAANSITPAAPITHVDGTIIKTSLAPEVYLLESGKKRHVTSPEVFHSWFDWEDLIIVSSSEMSFYAAGGDLGFRPGTLIKASGDPKVFLVDGGNKRHIVSPEIFAGLGYQWANVVSISPSEEDRYNRTDDLSSVGSHINGTLIKTAGAPEVYLLDGGKKRHIPNPEVFNSRYQWAEIVFISNDEMSNYAVGDRIGFRPGSLARASNQPQVYVITDTTKRHISSPSVLSLLGYRWERIILTTESELNNYTTGEPL